MRECVRLSKGWPNFSLLPSKDAINTVTSNNQAKEACQDREA
jgi:hypothetical protein